MRTKIVAALFAGTALVLYAAPAAAEDISSGPSKSSCSGVIGIGLARGHIDPNYVIDVVPGEIVSQASVSATCGHHSLRMKNYVVLSSSDTYGHRGLGEEQDIGYSYKRDVGTPIGTLDLSASIDYRAVDLGQGLGVSRDDYIELNAGISHRAQLGSLRITPTVILTKDIPVGHNNPLYWGKLGLRAEQPLGDVMLYVDGVFVHNINSTTAVPHKNAWYVETGISKRFENGWTGTIGVTLTQYAKRDSRFENRIERDGRLTPFARTGVMPGQPKLNPFVMFTYAF